MRAHVDGSQFAKPKLDVSRPVVRCALPDAVAGPEQESFACDVERIGDFQHNSASAE